MLACYLGALATAHDGHLLPPGKGGLILILGGLAMLCLALVSLLLRRPRLPPQLRPPARLTEAIIHGPGIESPQWVRSFQRLLAAKGLRDTRVLSSNDRGCVLVVHACPSCRRGESMGCERARRVIRRQARRVWPRARVLERVCNAEGRNICVFDLVTGGPR